MTVRACDDAWETPFRLWSEGENHVLVSFGGDGLPDREYDSISEPERTDIARVVCDTDESESGDDIVLVGLTFCQPLNADAFLASLVD